MSLCRKLDIILKKKKRKKSLNKRLNKFQQMILWHYRKNNCRMNKRNKKRLRKRVIKKRYRRRLTRKRIRRMLIRRNLKNILR